MKHFTCDKCGMPMEGQNIIRINDREYDICDKCIEFIMKGLKDKGNGIIPPETKKLYDELKDKFHY